MNDQTSFRRISAISAILSAPLALLSTFIAIAAVGFNFELLDETAGLVRLGSDAAELFAWSWILAAFGFYLLLIPAALYLKYWLKSQEPNLVGMSTVFGLGYCFIGAVSLITTATVLSPMMHAYAEAGGLQQDVLVIVFQAIANLAFASLSTLTFILGGVWWLGIGFELRARIISWVSSPWSWGSQRWAPAWGTYSISSCLPGLKCLIISWARYGPHGLGSSSYGG